MKVLASNKNMDQNIIGNPETITIIPDNQLKYGNKTSVWSLHQTTTKHYAEPLAKPKQESCN
jgi:hypothetical protein